MSAFPDPTKKQASHHANTLPYNPLFTQPLNFYPQPNKMANETLSNKDISSRDASEP
uniref:Bgt-20234 n=1 Tax=Blumeria graminis f. sp. tritici 96224 TaxID=1268274 RepID=A0A381KZK3_BLUGR